MSRRDDLAAALRPLSDRMHKGHSWVKTSNGPRRIDRKFDEIAMSEHVMGGNAFGLCPIAPGTSTCQVACLDLDSHKGETPWDDMLLIADGVAFALEQEGMAPHSFRSSGGHGIHIYLMWDTPQDAYSVREMLRATLVSCGLKPGTGGVAKTEVEIFPKQDEVPNDGFGSMFVLPWSGKSQPLVEFTGWRSSSSVRVLPRPPKVEVHRLAPGVLDGDVARIKSALDAIPNSGGAELDYDAWRNTVFAVHHATDGSDVGLSLVHEFSARSSKYDPEFLDTRVWPYVRSERSGSVVTDRSLYARAAAAGWQDPAIADAFEVIPESTATDGAGLRYRFVDDVEFSAGAAPLWLIKDVLPHAGLAVVYGESGSGKTFYVLSMVAAVARGLAEWRGHKVRKGKVGYIVAEGAQGFRNRLKALRSTFGQGEDMTLGVLASAPSFMEKKDIIDLVNAMRRWGKMDLIVVDTFAQVMPGANENAGEDVGLAIANCRTIHEVTGAMVLLIHHSGKDASKGARGWSGLRAAADVEIEIVRAEDDRVATVTKLKDGEDGIEFGFRLQQVPIGMDDEGAVVTSCVIEETKAVARDRKKGAPRGEWQAVVHQAAIDLSGLDGEGVDTDTLLTECVSRVPQDGAEGARDLRRQNCLKALTVLVTRGALVKNGACIKLPGGQ